MTNKKPLTKEEMLELLQRLNDGWNSDYWLCVASGTVHLMATGYGGEAMLSKSGGFDPSYIIGSFGRINADGGDW